MIESDREALEEGGEILPETEDIFQLVKLGAQVLILTEGDPDEMLDEEKLREKFDDWLNRILVEGTGKAASHAVSRGSGR